MSVLALASCEEMENYQTTIDAAPKLTYVNLKGGDTFSTRITHRPIGSQGSFHTEFQPNCNHEPRRCHRHCRIGSRSRGGI